MEHGLLSFFSSTISCYVLQISTEPEMFGETGRSSEEPEEWDIFGSK